MAEPGVLLVNHLIALQQFDNGLRQRSLRLLQQAMREIIQKLSTQYADLTPFQRARQAQMLKQFNEILTSSYQSAAQLNTQELTMLAKIEGRFASTFIESVTGGASVSAVAMSAERLAAIVNFPINGAQLGDWWATQGANAAFHVRRNIQLGLMQGETNQQIVHRLLQQSGGATRGVMGLIERNASSLVRTSINSVSTEAQLQTFSAQEEDLTDSYQFVAVLDDRTTIICASLDGQVYKYSDDTAPRPPMHINCRSTIIPVINWEKLGIKPAEDIVALQRAVALRTC